nr:coiled-coil domain-containing protein 106-like [Nothobranchius furzeri]
MKLEWQKDKTDELTKERDCLKEQLAACLTREPTRSVQHSSEVLSMSSLSSDGSFDKGSDSSTSTTSSDEDGQKRKKKGKAQKNKKSKKHDQIARTRVAAQNPKQVVTRYERILRLLKRGGTMSAAFKRLGVDRNTIVATAPIAELFIVAPDRYKELEKKKKKQGKKLLQQSVQIQS